MKVDEILGPEEAVVRPLPSLLRHHPLVAGLSLSGNGEVVQLLDSHSLALHLEQYRSAVAEKDQRRQPSTPLREAATTAEGDAKREQATARVLVVDDSKTARMRIVRPLLERGIEVCQACDGAEALEVLRTGPFSAIFTDLEMPVMDGFELLYELQSRNTAEPVIVASTLQHRTHRQRTEALGAAEHLGKPVDTEKLVETLKRWAPLLPLDAPVHAK
jgi:chemosensory pili system protein ChpA (sensor histidine kinase/response regulator)